MSHMQMGASDPAASDLMNLASGTSENPQSGSLPMLMQMHAGWSLMLMAQGYVVETQETGPRGHDKLYSPNWGMFAASHKLWGGSFRFDLMLSLEPATITNRSYPELFQTGETAYGKPLVDAQHPHNFIMGLGVHYAHSIAENAILELYFAPVGDPALGPVAFPHRASAEEIPQAPLSHHWQDSTHIADEVVTAGITYKEVRWKPADSTAPNPAKIAGSSSTARSIRGPRACRTFPARIGRRRYPLGRLASPNESRRATSSALPRPSNMRGPCRVRTGPPALIWGRNHDTFTQHNLNSYLLESVVPWRRKNFFTGRIELRGQRRPVQRSAGSGGATRPHRRKHVSHRRLHRRIHARHRHVSKDRNRRRREFQHLLHAGRHQTLLWESSGRGQRLFASPAEAVISCGARTPACRVETHLDTVPDLLNRTFTRVWR